MTHADLCALAVRWLKRPYSASGHGCQVAVSECKSGWTGEIPDAIGFRTGSDTTSGSIVVEVKVSRADFLADKGKPHRAEGAGLGTWRYYMAPEGLLRVEELPTRWGLLEVNSRGHVKPKAGPAVVAKSWRAFTDALPQYRHPSDHDRERTLLVMLLARLGDPEAMNLRLREANNINQRLIRRLEEERKRYQRLQSTLWTKELAAATPRAPDAGGAP
jgi:hypothetical protein